MFSQLKKDVEKVFTDKYIVVHSFQYITHFQRVKVLIK